MKKINKSEEEWRKVLSHDQYQVLRECGTENPFINEYYHNEQSGDYLCAGCGALLFHSSEKYESGSGWPSFFAPADEQNIESREDNSHGMLRTEIRCAACGGHLGHVFPDGPEPTGLRYCINSLSLKFRAD